MSVFPGTSHTSQARLEYQYSCRYSNVRCMNGWLVIKINYIKDEHKESVKAKNKSNVVGKELKWSFC